MTRRFAAIAMAGALLAAALPGPAAAADPIRRPAGELPDRIAALKDVTRPAIDDQQLLSQVKARMQARLQGAKPGRQDVIVRLSARPVAEAVPEGNTAQARARTAIRGQQDSVMAAARKADAKVTVLGRTRNASNLLMLNLSEAGIRALSRNRNVLSIKPVKNYTRDLEDTVPYIGATSVQGTGVQGAGVDVAVLDSGIDYTHKSLGGPGTKAAYDAAYGVSTADPANTVAPSWPAGRVSGGIDFVGEAWDGSAGGPALAPDADPIDAPDAASALGAAYGTDGGHGTHVADIIGGVNGVAPKSNLYGVKVCSSVSTACSGVALLQGVDWAMDPNGDGNLNDAVDIINMSLGSDYGTVVDDDLSLAVDRATSFAKVLTVASAGNGANRPYITGTPAAARTALSVAQTQVPSAVRFFLRVVAPAGIAGVYRNTETVEWAPLGDGFSGDVVFIGRGCPAGDVPVDDPYLDDPNGKVALIDRGACNISAKVDRAARAGAKAVLLGLVAPGDAVSFSQGDGTQFVPTMVIQQSLSSAIKGALTTDTVSVSVGTADSSPLVRGLAGSSSRGPSSNNKIKPEIGAPGASISAVSGSFTETAAFGGTSGAAPMVSGAAALLKSKYPGRSPIEIKAMLMNNAETTIWTDRAAISRQLAPITRIGGGEVRVNRSIKAPFAVWDLTGGSAALSFGFVDAWQDYFKTRTLKLRNYTNKPITLRISPRFRYADDKANGAVKITTLPFITLPPNGTRLLNVRISIDASKLREWTFDGGFGGADPAALDLLEYDGYLTFDQFGYKGDNLDPVHVPWQVLPRLSGNVAVTTPPVADTTPGVLTNKGHGTAAVELYSLLGTSPNLPPAPVGVQAPVIDIKSVGAQTFTVPAGYCGPNESFVYEFAVSLWERQTTAIVPGEIDIEIDTTGDGNTDYVVFSAPVSLYSSAIVGQAWTWVFDVAGGTLDAWFPTTFGTNDSNIVMDICGDQIGLDGANLAWAPGATTMAWDVYAYDWYYRDFALTDMVTGIQSIPGGERFWGPLADITHHATTPLALTDYSTGYPTNPSEMGVLVATNAWNESFAWMGGAPAGKDALQILLP